MEQLQYILFATILSFLLAQTTWAAEEGKTIEDMAIEEMPASEGIMMRQTSTVKGYQAIDVAGQTIDASYIEETLGERYGVIVLLHDIGDQFDSTGVITSLRHYLPEYGWSTLTLSLDYPLEVNIFLIEDDEKSAEESDVANTEDKLPSSETTSTDEKSDTPSQSEVDKTESDSKQGGDKTVLPPVSNKQRIGAVMNFLQAKDVKRIVLIGHGLGGDLAIDLLETLTAPISGLVLIGAPSLVEGKISKEFEFPILDLYGDRDLDTVALAVKDRKTLMKRIVNQFYQARRITGADHQFLGLQPTLTATIKGWLRKQFVEQGDN